MPVSGTVAKGWIEIAMKGFEQAKTQLAGLQTQGQKVAAGLSNIGSAFKVGFAAATGSIVGLLKAADPVRFEIFTQKLTILAIHIGRIFIPILQEAITWVDKAIAYFKGLTDEQREGILHWAKLGLKILAAGAALATVGGAVAKVASLFSSLWSVISGAYGVIAPVVRALANFVPIGKIIKLAALAFLLFRGEGDRVSGMFSKLKEMAMPVLEKLWGIIKQIADILVRAGGLVGGITEAIFDKLGSGLLDAFEEALPLIEKCLKAVGDLLDLIAKGLAEVTSVIKDAQAIYSVLKEKKLSELPKAVAQGVGRSLVNEGQSLAKSLTFGFLDETIDDVGDFVKDDVIGGKEDEDKMLAAREELDKPPEQTEGADYGGGDYGGDDEDKFSPLREFKKTESYGVEEAFKKAQARASFDPSKLSAYERESLAKTGKLEELLKGILGNTSPRPVAEESY